MGMVVVQVVMQLHRVGSGPRYVELWCLRGDRGLVIGLAVAGVPPYPCHFQSLVGTSMCAVYLHSSCSGWQNNEGRGKRRKYRLWPFGLKKV